MTEAEKMPRKKPQELRTKDGKPLEPLDKDGKPITSGVPTPKVRKMAEHYSLCLYLKGEAVSEWKTAMHDLQNAMKEAGLESVEINDQDGNPVIFALKTDERIKKQKRKDADVPY